MQFNFQQKYRFLYFSILIGLQCIGQIQDTVNYPSNFKAQKNIIYSKVGNWEGKLDIYYKNNNASPTPLVINIHGGGWNHGSKEEQTGFGSFFKNGFSVANIEYRLVHQGNAPAAIEDIRCALLYLVQNAKQFHFDTNKIVLMGSSAGGHLALMAGLQVKNSKFDVNCYYEDDFKIVAIIDKYGITDLSENEVLKSKSVQNWLGDEKQNLNFIQSVSPLYNVTPDSPATFIVHGNADNVVPYKQSELLFEKFIKMNVKTEFITVENGGHGKFPKEESKKVSDALWKFLKELGL
jgi:acetyl esterase/lipase